MTQITKSIGYLMMNCVLLLGMYSCNSNKANSGKSSTDSTTTTVTTTTDSTTVGNEHTNGSSNTNTANNNATETSKMSATGNSEKNAEMASEPTGPAVLGVTSAAFPNNGVIPGKYTCDGQGVTPPLSVTNIPSGTRSLAVIIHDYHAEPSGGYSYWIIWNLDTTGNIPESFRNDFESVNAAKQYGYTPICSKSGNHKYYFIVYALDAKLNMNKNTNKKAIENVMRGHVLGKGELVGIYNKHLE